jgi:hypothetical protein
MKIFWGEVGEWMGEFGKDRKDGRYMALGSPSPSLVLGRQ